MRIDSSTVALASERKFSSYRETNTTLSASHTYGTAAGNGSAADLMLEEDTVELEASESKGFDLKAYRDEKMLELAKNKLQRSSNLATLPDSEELNLIELILDAMEDKDGRRPSSHQRLESLRSHLSAYSQSFQSFSSFSAEIQAAAAQQNASSTRAASEKYVFTRSTLVMEDEATSFSATGAVRTGDGREISFHIDVSMSRRFIEQTNLDVEMTMANLVDPLVINFDTDAVSVSDQKFLFDINADGAADSISYLNEGSGFLALDKNGDGEINDGSELFGTRTGDGFAELATYDEDGNGWIDENDSVFKDLKVWAFNEDGSSRLISLLDANVGAIYLGNTGTQFSLTDRANNTNGVIRSSGVYLKEDGTAGTVQHLDLSL